MHERLTLARFEELADAYGGSVARWPEPYRDAAMAMASQPAARIMLDKASALDGTLDAWRVTAPADLLRERVTRSAPAPACRIVARARLWWAGVGIAAALAGATAGAATVAITSPIDMTSDSSTSFGSVAGSES